MKGMKDGDKPLLNQVSNIVPAEDILSVTNVNLCRLGGGFSKGVSRGIAENVRRGKSQLVGRGCIKVRLDPVGGDGEMLGVDMGEDIIPKV